MNTKFIHLLYVPTMACNMQCRYCYLEDHTIDTLRGGDCLETLQYAIAKFREADVVPFNISLHGGEVTAQSDDTSTTFTVILPQKGGPGNEPE